jgi:hypothetical protein
MERLFGMLLIILTICGCAASLEQAPPHAGMHLSSMYPHPAQSVTDTKKFASIAAFQAAILNFAIPGKMNVRDSKASSNKGDKGGEHKQDKTEFVKHQIQQSVMDQFLKRLSKPCNCRFTKMLKGESPDLHTFASSSVNSSDDFCTSLEGKLCSTDATMSEQKEYGLRTRVMESKTSVSGKSCLPRECMTEDDLKSLAMFTLKQALDIIPGENHKLELRVDCSKHGGPTTSLRIGGPTTSLRSRGVSIASPLVSLLAAFMLLRVGIADE